MGFSLDNFFEQIKRSTQGSAGTFKEGSIMDRLNAAFANQLLFTDPETGEELRPKYEPQDENGLFTLYVASKDGLRNWKHTIKTEEC